MKEKTIFQKFVGGSTVDTEIITKFIARQIFVQRRSLHKLD